MRISDWSSDVCSSDLIEAERRARRAEAARQAAGEQPSGFQLLARVHGLGLGTADLLDSEAFTRQFADRQAVGRFGGLTGAPDESGNRRREKGLARAGNVRVRHAMIQFRSEEHTSELQSLMRTSYAVFCLKKKKHKN